MKYPIVVHWENPTLPAGFHYQYGTVNVRLTVDEQGMPQDLTVVASPDPALNQFVLDAVHQYRFKPATHKGKPIRTTINVTVKFDPR